MYIHYLAKYRFDVENNYWSPSLSDFGRQNNDFCPDRKCEELYSDLHNLDGYEEINDYLVEGGEITIYATFCMEIDFPEAPTGSHPHWCASDCGYCDRMDSWTDALERESEDITEDLENELRDVDGFVSLESNE